MNKNKKIIKKKSYFQNDEIYHNNFLNIENLKKTNKIIFSLSTLPNKFIDPSFKFVIEKLQTQQLKPDFIIINICNEYRRVFDYDKKIINEKINEHTKSNVYINLCKTDYGPITKILGIIEFQEDVQLDDNDLIIVIDDDITYIDNLSLLYKLNDLLYNGDCICINQKYNITKACTTTIFTSPYSGQTVYGWMSWSLKYKFINSLYDFYLDNIEIEQNMWKHDDLFVALFISKYKLKTSEIKINSVVDIKNNGTVSLQLDNINNGDYRTKLEKKYKNKIYFNICDEIKNTACLNYEVGNNSVKFIKN